MMNRSHSLRSKRPLVCLAGIATGTLWLLGLPAGGHAVVYNWAGANWTAGAPAAGASVSQSFNANFINVQIANNAPGSATGGTWAGGYPAIEATTTNGGVNNQRALQLYLNTEPSTTSFIQVTVRFASLVTATSFTLYDVDLSAGTWRDTISQIQGVTQTGQALGVSGVTPGTTNTVTGTGLTTVVTGTANNNPSTLAGGNVTFNFAQPITEFTFRWSNTDAGLGTQLIGLGTLNYTLVPEVSPGWVTLGVAGLVVGTQVLRRRRRKSEAPA